jgi:hypothetical protein
VKGLQEGFDTGYNFGIVKGIENGVEVGYMIGCLEVWREEIQMKLKELEESEDGEKGKEKNKDVEDEIKLCQGRVTKLEKAIVLCETCIAIDASSSSSTRDDNDGGLLQVDGQGQQQKQHEEEEEEEVSATSNINAGVDNEEEGTDGPTHDLKDNIQRARASFALCSRTIFGKSFPIKNALAVGGVEQLASTEW